MVEHKIDNKIQVNLVIELTFMVRNHSLKVMEIEGKHIHNNSKVALDNYLFKSSTLLLEIKQLLN